MKFLKDFDLNNKTVIVRGDFDVLLDNKGKILDDFKIRKAIPTIKYLLENQPVKIILIGNGSLSGVAKRLSQLLDHEIKFAKNIKGLGKSEITMLEGLTPEQEKDESFIEKLAKSADIYINDCFSASHHGLGSIIGIPKYIDKGAGLLLEEEINISKSLLEEPRRPLIVILGGEKVDTKIPVLMKFLELADHVLIGGVLAPAILHAKKISLSYVDVSLEIEEMLSSLELTNPKLHLPIDALVGLKDRREDYLRKSGAGKIRLEEQMFDIGPETVRMFSDIISTAGTVIWHGPMGLIEDERFSNGTLSIASAILRSNAFSVVGGSHTGSFLAQNNLRGKFDHISTGGGAMLKYFVNQELPGIKALL